MNVLGKWPAAAVAVAVLGASLALTSIPAAAAEAEVEELQMPAWLTRDGKRQPLAPGTQLRSGDTITTGDGSRVLLRLAEGSAVKLGENARFELASVAQTRTGGQLRFSARLELRQGAFRFTTPPDDKAKGTRDVEVKFATLTATVTGTDLWGKSADGQEIVALIDGKISVTRRGDAPVAMTEAKTVYVAPPDAPPRPVSAITLAQLNAYAQETELQPGAGVASRIGNYKIYAARTPNQQEALAVYERLRDAGYAAAIQPAVSQGKQIYQVRIAGILTEADGVAVAIKLRVQLGLQDVHVSLQ
jgi:hypothetical protein